MSIWDMRIAEQFLFLGVGNWKVVCKQKNDFARLVSSIPAIHAWIMYILGLRVLLQSQIWQTREYSQYTTGKHDFQLLAKFSLFLSQNTKAVKYRNETSKTSASFCTKNHQNPFGSLGERGDWSLRASSKKVQKMFMRMSRLHAFIARSKVL